MKKRNEVSIEYFFYNCSQWMVAGSGDPPLPHNVYLHPDNPAQGKTWMNQGALSFDRLKLTNNRRPLVRGQVSLHSMHKYQPRLHIQTTKFGDKHLELDPNKALTFAFPETVFTTVTAYQNQQITRLKIASNPFAKGFREAAKTRESNEETISLSYPPSNSQLIEQGNGPYNPSSNNDGSNSAMYTNYLSASSLLGNPSLFPVHTVPSHFNCLPTNSRIGQTPLWMMPPTSESRNNSEPWQLSKSTAEKSVFPVITLGPTMALTSQIWPSTANETLVTNSWCSATRSKRSDNVWSHVMPVRSAIPLDHCWMSTEAEHV